MDFEPLFRLVAPFKNRSSVKAARNILARGIPWRLEALAVLYNTDKRRRLDSHGYTTYYTRHLQARRRAVRSVLEIGVGGYTSPTSGGESLRMWRTYFPNAEIYGLDIDKKDLPAEDRITVLQGDQGDQAFLRGLAEQFGPFDLVVDDGAHVGSLQEASFDALFPTLPSGAFYVIEDLSTAYSEDWEGGPPGTPGTAVDLVKRLIDSVHVGPLPISSVHVYPEITFIEKASSIRPS